MAMNGRNTNRMKKFVLPSLCLVIIASYLDMAETVRILGFNLDAAQRNDTFIRYSTLLTVPHDMTICLRFNVNVFRLFNGLMYLLVDGDTSFAEQPISLDVYFEKIRTKHGGYGRFYGLPANLATNIWYHYCQVRDVVNGEGLVYLDGKLFIHTKNITSYDPDDRGIRHFTIGQEDAFNPRTSFSGYITQVNLWTRTLSSEEVEKIASCQEDLEGNMVKWSGPWNESNVETTHIPLQQVCEMGRQTLVVVRLPLLKFVEAVVTCKALDGEIRTPMNQEESDEDDRLLGDWSKKYCKRRMWGGMTDVVRDGYWVNPYTGRVYRDHEVNFYVGNPDGEKYQNCLMKRSDINMVLDTTCGKACCGLCRISTRRTWTLRGICEEEKRMYYLDLEEDPLGFRGYGEYAVRQVNGSQWQWYNSINNKTMAVYVPEKNELNYPMGRRIWTLKTEVCGMNPGGMRELTLSACGVGRFTCSDGSCIKFTSRCDLMFDCLDKSDESFCDIINFPEDYRWKLPPRPTSDSPLPISVNVTIDTLTVDTQTMMMSVSYKLRMTWLDNRLTYNNLKVLTRLNTISLQQVGRLWRPLIGYINTDDIQQSVVDDSSITTILLDQEGYTPDLTNSYEVEIFDGSKNRLSTLRKYYTTYTCNFDLALYPFDIQTCYLRLQIISASNEYLIFNDTASFVDYFGPRQLVEYGIGRIQLKVDNTQQYVDVRVTIELVRRYGYAMLNIYIPSLTLLVISYVTLYFRARIFEVRVMTALTSLLVLATLFTTASVSLPKTSYLKMVDLWLLFCIMVIFGIILFHTFIDKDLERRELLEKEQPVRNAWTPPHKVAPVDGEEDTSDENPPGWLWNYVVKKVTDYIWLSKFIIFTVFASFNVMYWGYLAVTSGLVYTIVFIG